MEIIFEPGKIRWVGPKGKTLLAIAAEAGVYIDGNCAGEGTCGKCKVRIIGKTPEKPSSSETGKLTSREIEQGYRLACLYRPAEDIVVEVSIPNEAEKRKTRIGALSEPILLNHVLTKFTVKVEEPSLKNQRSDDRRIKAACGRDEIRIHPDVYPVLPGILRNNPFVTISMRENEIIHIEEGDTSGKCFGVSFDIGTTTVAGMLWDMVTGELLAVDAATNPQGVYGADVISRINYAGESTENLRQIHQKIIDCLNNMILTLTDSANVKIEHIYEIAVVGNTTMAHLYMNVDPGQLARAPFVPVFCAGVYEDARSRGLKAHERAKAYFMPCVAGHVGSDITAGLVASGMLHGEGLKLMLDVGTNGEIVLAKDGEAIACSTAAGPAFEGASIFQGMRAADGAVEAVEISSKDVIIKTISEREPIGLCGSGIIDAVAALVKTGIVDRTGRLPDREKLLENGFSEEVANRIKRTEQGKVFVLAYREGRDDIVITQKDIREVQLAKAAIRAGIKLMTRQMGVREEEIDKLFIAGTFGNHIKAESAVMIGLIPDIGQDKIAYIGNAAGIGASLALLSSSKRAEAENTSSSIKHLELSTCKDFQDVYLQEMMFS